MANEVCKYHNDLNTVKMRKWTTEEMNFFFSIVAKAKDKGTQKIVFTKEQLKDLAKYDEKHNLRFKDILNKVVKHVSQLQYIEETSHSLKIMNLFQTFQLDWNNDYSDVKVTVRLSEDFEYVLNQFELNFTYFSLEEFVNLKSTYSKQMYRQLKQWKKQGEKEYTVDEFRTLLDIPKSYKASHIDTRILKPIQRELSQCFTNFKVKPIKKKTKGNPIIGYAFKWTPERTNQWVEGQPQHNPNKPKKVAKSIVPDWYEDVKEETPNEELLNEVLAKQSKLKDEK